MIEQILDAPIHGWLENKDSNNENNIVISSRIRLARNFKNIPFTNTKNDEAIKKVNVLMRSVIADLAKVDKKEYGNINLEKLSDVERGVLKEKHLISPMLNDNPLNRSLIINNDASVAIMVNEEDHLRIQVMKAGLNLFEAYEQAVIIDDTIEAKHEYAFSEKYGYLTACPTNVGTGLRASVMLHLPALVLTNKINRIIRGITQLGYAVRGLYGEGSSALGNIFQISNQVTMGISEHDTIEQLTNVIKQLVKEEQNCRQKLLIQDKMAVEDRVYRALGVLKNARIISGNEALTCISAVQLGQDMGIIKPIKNYNFNELQLITSPYFLKKYSSKEDMTSRDRDIYRAQIIRDKLK